VRRGVGLLIFTNLPGLGLVAILQARGTYDPEEKRPQSFPGTCQVTCHGDLENDENAMDGLFRECSEELGQTAAQHLLALKSSLRELTHLKTDKKDMLTFGLHIPDPSFLTLIPGSGTAGYRYVTHGHAIVDITTEHRDSGVADLTVTAMFRDEQNALIRGFFLFDGSSQ
jgi:hypothetical protein